MHGLRVLIVDDDQDGAFLMAQALSARGAEVTLLESAEEAVAALQRIRPHVLISDIAMPNVDGYELLRRVRALPQELGGDTPALAVSAHAGQQVLKRVLDSGFHRYASKPIDVENFVAAVAELGRSASS
jgi:CheY-like chemotaxis protein